MSLHYRGSQEKSFPSYEACSIFYENASSSFDINVSNWTVRPKPEGRIIRKPEGRIFNHKAEMIINRKAEFDRKAESLSNLIYACYITAKKYG